MGYYTDFTLSIVVDTNAALGLETNKDQESAIVQAILRMEPEGCSYLHAFVSSDEPIPTLLLDEPQRMKWYTYKDDMRKLSSMCGDILFKLHGKGEEEGDKWVTYFMNGRMQHCPAVITEEYGDFDSEKMK